MNAFICPKAEMIKQDHQDSNSIIAVSFGLCSPTVNNSDSKDFRTLRIGINRK